MAIRQVHYSASRGGRSAKRRWLRGAGGHGNQGTLWLCQQFAIENDHL